MNELKEKIYSIEEIKDLKLEKKNIMNIQKRDNV